MRSKLISKLPGLMKVMCMMGCALFYFSCTKYVPGPQGDQGESGKPGNLKQTHVSAFRVSSSSWSLSDSLWETSLFISGISREVVEKGEVILYMERDAEWWPLPYGKDFVFTKYSTEFQRIRLYCEHIHSGTPARPIDANYRVVILAPAK